MEDLGWNRKNQDWMSELLKDVVLNLNNHGFATSIGSVWETVRVFSPFHDVLSEQVEAVLREYGLDVYAVVQDESPCGAYQHNVCTVYIGAKPSEPRWYEMDGIYRKSVLDGAKL